MIAAPDLGAVEILRELLDTCPFPARWHTGAGEIAAVFGDFRAAVETLERGEWWEPEAVAAARGRLEALPRPEGRHPYLDAILPTLEAMELALELLAARIDPADAP